jgi:hypothetical protein
MSVADTDTRTGAERECDAAAALVREVAGPSAQADPRAWVALQLQVGGAALRRRPGPRRALVAGAIAVMFAAVALAVWRRGAAPSGSAGDVVMALEGGSRARVEKGSQVRLVSASLVLEDGSAELTVGTGPGAVKEIRAGGYRIQAAAARFEIHWWRIDQRLEAYVYTGQITVSNERGRAVATVDAGQRFVTTGAGARATDTGAAPPPLATEPPRTPRKATKTDTVAPPREPAKLGVVATRDPRPRAGGRLSYDAGGDDCRGEPARWTFDEAAGGFAAAGAFTRLSIDRGRAWCGSGSLLADASFTLDGPRDERNMLVRQTGHAVVTLDPPIDLTNRTVTVHLFVEADPSFRFGAGFYVQSAGKKANSPWLQNQMPGRWLTLRHTYGVENRIWEGGTARVDAVSKLAISVWILGPVRISKARVYIDEVDIR